MAADINGTVFIEWAFHRISAIRSSGFEHLLQRSRPGFQRLVHRDDHICVCKDIFVCHLADHPVGAGQFSHFPIRNFTDEIAESRRKEISRIQIVFDLHTLAVSEGHLADRGSDSVAVQRIGGHHPASLYILIQPVVKIHNLRIIREIVLILGQADPYQTVPCFFQLRCDDILLFCHIHGKGNQRGRHIDIIERSGHTVLAADGGQTESQLCIIRPQKRRKGLAPAGRIFRHTAEVFLEGETNLPVISAGGDNPGNGLRHRIDGAVVGAPTGYVGIETITHHGHRIGLSILYRNLGHHGLGFRHLELSAVGHQYAAGSDGRVKHFHQAFLRTHIQIFQHIQPCLPHIRHFLPAVQHISFPGRNIHQHLRFLMSAVGIQERSGNVDDLLSSPFQHQTGTFCHHSHFHGFQILLVSVFQEFSHIGRIHHHSHTLLGLGNSDFRSIQAGIFFRNFIQVDLQAVRQLSNGYGYAAGSEIVAFFDQTAYFLPAEHSLNLSLRGSISFLHLSAAGLDGLFRMHFGGAGGAAAAVAASAASQKNDDIARIRRLPDHGTAGGSAHHGPDFHTFCHVIRMINFFYVSGGQSDLIPIGTISVSRRADQFLLRQFPFHGFLYGNRGIGRTGHTHGLIYVCSSGKGIPDGSAKTGGGAAEGLDLRGVIVGFVFKVDQPLFFHSVHIHRNHDAAGIDFLGLFLILQFPFRFQFSHGHQGQIHQADKLIFSSFEDFFPIRQILLIRSDDGLLVVAFLEIHLRQFCGEGGVAAVIGPVGIQHADLRHGGIPLFLSAEITMDMKEIFKGHGQIQRLIQLFQL